MNVVTREIYKNAVAELLPSNGNAKTSVIIHKGGVTIDKDKQVITFPAEDADAILTFILNLLRETREP